MKYIESFIFSIRNANISEFGFWSWAFLMLALGLIIYSILTFRLSRDHNNYLAEDHPMPFFGFILKASTYFWFVFRILISAMIIWGVCLTNVATGTLDQLNNIVNPELDYLELQHDMDQALISGVYKLTKPRDILIGDYKKNKKIDSLNTLERSLLVPFNNLLNMSDVWFNFYSKDSVELIIKKSLDTAMTKGNIYYEINSLKKEVIIDSTLYSFDILNKDSILLYRNGFQYSLNRYKAYKSE